MKKADVKVGIEAMEWVPVWKALSTVGCSVAAPDAHRHVYPPGELARPIAGAHASGGLFAFGTLRAAWTFILDGPLTWPSPRATVAAAALGAQAVTRAEVSCKRCDGRLPRDSIVVPSGTVLCEAIMAWE